MKIRNFIAELCDSRASKSKMLDMICRYDKLMDIDVVD